MDVHVTTPVLFLHLQIIFADGCFSNQDKYCYILFCNDKYQSYSWSLWWHGLETFV